ncbi:hypothetical protein BH11PSE4_BH11PSE4_22810 [soil metagenome]
MTISATHPIEVRRTVRGGLALWVGTGLYGLLLYAGSQLLRDPDTLWQITLGQWIVTHRAVPQTDIYSFTMQGQPWISTQWLAQVLYAQAWSIAGWAGPVVLAAGAIALTFALLARELTRRLSESAALIFVAAAITLTAAHLLARPHVLAMPVMVAWVGSLIAAADRRGAPSFALLPLMVLWANLHGGFVLGLALIAPIAVDAVWNAQRDARRALALRWALFAIAAVVASCLTPYGWNALLAARKILGLGEALKLIGEWHAVDFGHLGLFEICLLSMIGLVLLRGVTLPPLRIVVLLGLLHMALSASRNQEVFALLAPLFVAAPLARQIGIADAAAKDVPRPYGLDAVLAAAMLVATWFAASLERYAPDQRNSPVAAVVELKKLHLDRVFNDYDFGGYLIANGVPTFIDGRTELFGEKFFVDHNNASGLMQPENLFRLLKNYDIEATLMRTQSAATTLLDHMDGWQKIYSDDIATIHLRKSGAAHSADPVVRP